MLKVSLELEKKVGNWELSCYTQTAQSQSTNCVLSVVAFEQYLEESGISWSKPFSIHVSLCEAASSHVLSVPEQIQKHVLGQMIYWGKKAQLQSLKYLIFISRIFWEQTHNEL